MYEGIPNGGSSWSSRRWNEQALGSVVGGKPHETTNALLVVSAVAWYPT